MCEAVRACTDPTEVLTYKDKGVCERCWLLHCCDEIPFHLKDAGHLTQRQLKGLTRKYQRLLKENRNV